MHKPVPEMSFQVAAAHWIDSLNSNVSHPPSGGTKHELENLNIETIDFYYWRGKKKPWVISSVKETLNLWMEMVGVSFWKKQFAEQFPAATFVPLWASDQKEGLARESNAPDRAHKYSRT